MVWKIDHHSDYLFLRRRITDHFGHGELEDSHPLAVFTKPAKINWSTAGGIVRCAYLFDKTKGRVSVSILGIALGVALGLALFVSACRRRVQRLIAVTKERASLAEHTRREMGSQRTDPT